MCEKENSMWGDPDIEWTAIPHTEMMDAVREMHERCSTIFDAQSKEQQEAIFKNRLYQKRRNWRHQLRLKQRKNTGFEESVEENASNTSLDDLGNIIQQAHRY